VSVEGVVPVAVPIVADEGQGVELGVGDLDAFGVPLAVALGFDRRPVSVVVAEMSSMIVR
jgi:hypothetical protein